MNDRNVETIEQVTRFLGGSEALDFRALSVGEKYNWIGEVVIRFRYHRLKRAEKGVIRRYIERITGYSRSQVSRLIMQYKRVGRLKRMSYRRHRFPRSRPRDNSDNGLVETKNGSVLRKQLGYAHIPQAYAELLNGYHKGYLNPYINFHRLCFSPVSVMDHRGKIKKTYPY